MTRQAVRVPIRVPVRVKVCGITRSTDAETAVALGAAALGFIFSDRSPRRVSVAQAAAIVRELPPFVSPVGVFVNAPLAEVRATLAATGIGTAQLHGEESPEFCGSLPGRVIKAVRPRSEAELAALAAYPVQAFLVDAYDPDRPGGTGRTGDWTLAAAAQAHGPVILAGGLAPENVAEAVTTVRPFAVDVNSGVESAPGRKDPARLRAFFQALPEV